MIEVTVPEFGESIQEVQVSQWLKQPGQWVDRDEDLVELETEKASQALPSPGAGVVHKIHVANGEFAKVGDVLAELDPDGERPIDAVTGERSAPAEYGLLVMPAAQRLLDEHGLAAQQITPSGPGGRLTKEDVLRYLERETVQQPNPPTGASTAGDEAAPSQDVDHREPAEQRREEIRPLSMIRRTIAARLVEAQQVAALLTTFNEIDMQPVIDLRTRYQEAFQKKHGVKLGFMSFFAKASVEALRRFPAVNTEVRGNDVVYRNYCDIGIAIGSGKGLVVPVLRDVQKMSFAEVERAIGQFGQMAMENKIKPQDLVGGTFTISNGGVYGSLLSTPIVNPPQSGILGLHAIQQRPVARDGQVVIRPMMYVALTYDHRIVDGREAVTFLRTIKEVLEEPARLFLEV